MFNNFFVNAKFPKSFLSYVVALITKVGSPHSLDVPTNFLIEEIVQIVCKDHNHSDGLLVYGVGS